MIVSPPALRLHNFLDQLCEIGPGEDFRALCADALSYHEDVDELEDRVKRLMVTALEQNDDWARKCAAYSGALLRISDEAHALWDAAGGEPVYPELRELCAAIMDARELLDRAERGAT